MKNRFSRMIALAITIMAVGCSPKANTTPFFVQISDPQLGFINESEDFTPERENMERVAAKINTLKPDFVVFSGDYVQWRTDENALEGFGQMCKLFDKDIPLYFVPGNHDVGEATQEDVAAFVARYGHDRFIFEGDGYTAIGYNSCVIKTIAEGEPKEYEWLRQSLEEAAKREHPIILVAHHPLFVESPEEENAGVNIPLEVRGKYLSLFKEYGVDLVLAGHLHHCTKAEFEGIRLATTSAIGRPLGDEPSGVTIVTIQEGSPIPTFYPIDAIPEHIE
jgi:3',5'-cyclic AMP phosphodiesterase CpdA